MDYFANPSAQRKLGMVTVIAVLLLAVTISIGVFGAQAAPAPATLQASLPNGGFETTDLTDWTTGGSAARVEVLQATNFTTSAGPAPTPTEGNYFALLCNGPGRRNEAPQGNIDADGLVTQEYDTSILTKTLTLLASDVPATLSFDWSFLTDENRSALDSFDDFFQVTLNGVVVLAGSRPTGGVSPYPDVGGMNNVAYTVESPGATDDCIFGDGRNSFQTFRTMISNDGTYTLAFLVADQGDPYDDSGLLIDNVQLTPEIDLEIAKTATPDPAVAGEPLIYEVTVANHGSGRAVGVVVTDTLPAEVEFIWHTLPTFPTDPTLPQGCTFAPSAGPGGEDQLFCDLGDMLGGESASFEIEVDVDADALAHGTLALTNTAVVDSLTADGNLRNNTKILETILHDSADLRVVKMSKPGTQVQAGEFFTYTVFVENLGPSYARYVSIRDEILSSGDFTVESVILDPNRNHSGPFYEPSPEGGVTMEINLVDPLEPQDIFGRGRWIIQIVVRANETQDVNNLVNVFTRAGGTPDPDLSNNEAIDFIAVTSVADLEITKEASGETMEAGSAVSVQPNQVTAGQSLTYTLTVTNQGPSRAENVVLQDRLPTWLVVTSATPSQGSCNTGTPGEPLDKLTCGLGTLAPVASAAVVIHADVPPWVPEGAILANDVFVYSDIFDDTNTNNFATNLTLISAWADLSVSKVQWPAAVLPGEEIEYIITVANSGPSDAGWAIVSDTIPSGITNVTWECTSFGGATCPTSGSGNLYHTASLPVGWKVVYKVRGVRGAWTVGQDITNTATVAPSAGIEDPGFANNSAVAANRTQVVYLPLVFKSLGRPSGPDLVVEQLLATSDNVQVVIKNRGTEPVTKGLWIDVYLDPDRAPTVVNQIWRDLASQGLAWGIIENALPLQPGETLTLNVGDDYYSDSYSYVDWPIPIGTLVYAQVDSYGDGTFGTVLEIHEASGGVYNNILDPVLSGEGHGVFPSSVTSQEPSFQGLPRRP